MNREATEFTEMELRAQNFCRDNCRGHLLYTWQIAAMFAEHILSKDRQEQREKMKQVEQLREFHQAFGLPIRKEPTIINSKEFNLRHRLLEEEVRELKDAWLDNDEVEVADAIIDIMYVLVGTALQMGYADYIVKMFDEVHRSNMSKLTKDGKVLLREDGKVLKSDQFTPPNLIDILTSLKEEQ